MKKTAAAEPRTPLFDRVFRPETITLKNGHTVQRPRSRTPLIAAVVLKVITREDCLLLPKGEKIAKILKL